MWFIFPQKPFKPTHNDVDQMTWQTADLSDIRQKPFTVFTGLIQCNKSYISFRGKPGADCGWDLQGKNESRALLKSICEAMPVGSAPAVIQTIATAAPKIFFLTRRCLKGRKVACIRSKEIAPRLINDAKGETVYKTAIAIKKLFGRLVRLVVQSSHMCPTSRKSIIKLAPTNISATAWLITRYILRLRRLRSLR